MTSKSEDKSEVKFEILNEKQFIKVEKKSIIKDNCLSERKENKLNFTDEIYSEILMKIKQYEIKFKSFYNNNKQNQSLETKNEIIKLIEIIYKLNNELISFLGKKNILEEKEINEIKNYTLQINLKINELNQKISSSLNFYNEQINFSNELISSFKNLSKMLNLNFQKKFKQLKCFY